MLSVIRTNMGADELTRHIYDFTLNADQNVTEYTVPAADMYTLTSQDTYYIKLDWDAQVPVREVKEMTTEYMAQYNLERGHQGLEYATPHEIYYESKTLAA